MPILLPGEPLSTPSRTSVAEHYPLAQDYTLYVSKGASQTVLDFAKHLESGRMDEILLEHGLVPAARETR